MDLGEGPGMASLRMSRRGWRAGGGPREGAPYAKAVHADREEVVPGEVAGPDCRTGPAGMVRIWVSVWREKGKALEMLYSGKKAPGAGTEHESLCWLVFLAVAWSSTEGA